nr:MFS transporter [Teredinibacter turnerae]
MPSAFLSNGKYLLAFGFLAVFVGNFGQSFFVGAFGAPIQASLGLTASGYGLIYSLATLLAGTSLMVAGSWIDRIPLARFTFFVSLGLIVACALFTVAMHPVILVMALYFLRLCGQGLLPHTGVTVMARCFDSHRGKAISVAASGVPVGEIVLPLLAALLIAQFGWQMTWLFVAGFVIVVFLPVYPLLLSRATAAGYQFNPAPSRVEKGESNDKAGAARRELLTDRRFWFALPALVAAPFVVTGIFIHQNFVMDQRAWSGDFFAMGFVLYGIVHWVSSIAAGVAVDRFSASRLLPLYNLPMFLALAAVAFLQGDYLVFVLLGLLGVSIGSSGPVGGALWAETYGTARLGTIRSMVASFGVWSTSLSPFLFGLLIDTGVTLTELAAALAAYVLLACIMASRSYRVSATALTR